MPFSALYLYVTYSGIPREKQLQDKPIIALKKTQANASTKNKVYFQQKTRMDANMLVVFFKIHLSLNLG